VLRGLDGRPIRLQGKKHAALNYLLQSAGAIVTKRWGVIASNMITEAGLQYEVDYQWLSYIHDEWNLAVIPTHVDTVKGILEWSIQDAGHYYRLKVPLNSEAKDGNNWAEVH
jgi:DNA polymerase I-like protein with 3'-5' exonuclease and polymerase domains